MKNNNELDGFEGLFERDDTKGDFIPLFIEEPKKDERDYPVEDTKKEEEIDIETQTRMIFEDAYIQGEKAGFEMGMRKAEPLLKRLNQYLDEISDFKKELVKEAEKLAFELAFVFAEAIVLKKCDEDRDVILNMIRKALEICEEKVNITVRVRRDDIKYLDQERLRHLNIIADETLNTSGFVIETNFGDIDGRIETQLEELKKSLLHEDAC